MKKRTHAKKANFSGLQHSIIKGLHFLLISDLVYIISKVLSKKLVN